MLDVELLCAALLSA